MAIYAPKFVHKIPTQRSWLLYTKSIEPRSNPWFIVIMYSMKTTSRTHFYMAGLLMCIGLFLSTLPVHAEVAGAPATAPEQATDRKDANATRKIQLSEAVQNRMINLSENVSKRGEALITRFESIIGRIDTRINKLKAQNIDTSIAEKRLTEAKTSLGLAKDLITKLASAPNAIKSESPREAFKQTRADMHTLKSYLRDTHIAIIDTVSLLKEAVAASDKQKGVSEAVSNAPKLAE